MERRVKGFRSIKLWNPFIGDDFLYSVTNCIPEISLSIAMEKLV